jgi:hypothetical protein
MSNQPPWLKGKAQSKGKGGKNFLLDDPEDRAEAKAGHPPTTKEEAAEDRNKPAKKQAILNLMASKGGKK